MSENFNDEQTSRIYDDILLKVGNLIADMQAESDDESVICAKTEACKLLTKLQDGITEEYSLLKRNTEWKRYTIAFYGETNAGKSTIIETLRIILGEKTKLDSSNVFLDIQNRNGITQESFDLIRKDIMGFDKKVNTAKVEIETLKNEEEQARNTVQQEVYSLKEQVDCEKRKRNIWQKIIFLFKKSPLEISFIEKKHMLEDLSKEYGKKRDDLEGFLRENQRQYDDSLAKEKALQEKCKLLEQYADGKIIGAGMSDFTKTNTSYSFNIDGVGFDLIDVPGIEGKEETVNDSIIEAVQKAHAVFYVTRKPSAPQTGDAKEGTLEKIKRHLGAQTEVWTIFNQSVTNPIRLQNALVNQDDSASLNNLHRIIDDKLGSDHYRGEIILSAYPAFLAAANCLIPGSKENQSKIKFLNKYSEDMILQTSQFKDFIHLLPKDVIANWEEKIVFSNYNKAIVTINKAIEQIELLQALKFKPLEKTISNSVKDSQKQLDNGLETLRVRLDGVAADVIQEFESVVREKIYNEIDDDISNDSFESNLRDIMKKQQEMLQTNFSNRAEYEFELFQQAITNTIKRAKEHMNSLLHTVEYIPELKEFNLKIDIDNGLSTWGIISTVGGAIILILSGVTGVGLVLGAIGLLASAWSSIRSFFSSSYKMEQQRKSADENIRKVSREIEAVIGEQISKLYPELEKKVCEINLQLNKPVYVVKKINQNLTSTKEAFQKIIGSIRGEMKR